MPDGQRRPLVLAAVRLGSALVAAVVVAVGFFGESLAYALVVGLVIGAGFAVVGHLRDRRDGERTDHP